MKISIKRGHAYGLLTFLVTLACGLFVCRNAGAFEGAVALMTISLAFCMAALVIVCLSEGTRPIAYASLLYLTLFYIVPGIIHLNTGRFPFFGMTYSDHVASKAALLVLIFSAVVSLVVSIGAGAGSNVAPAVSRDAVTPKTWVILALSFVSVAAGGAVGFDSLLLSRGDLSESVGVLSPSDLILFQVARSSAFFAFVLSVFVGRRAKTGLSYLLVLATFLICLVANNPLAMPRYMVGAYALIGAFTFSALGRTAKSLGVAVAAISQVTIFPFLSDVSRGGGAAAYAFKPLEYISTHGDFDGFQSTLNAVEWIDGNGLMLGRQIGSALLFWVPRATFPGKSVGTGADAAEYVGYPYTNISSPLPAELYVDFGLVGALALSFCFAVAVNRMDQRYESSRVGGDTFMRVALAAIAGYSFIVLRGSLVAVVGPVVFSVALLLLLRQLNRVRVGVQ